MYAILGYDFCLFMLMFSALNIELFAFSANFLAPHAWLYGWTMQTKSQHKVNWRNIEINRCIECIDLI